MNAPDEGLIVPSAWPDEATLASSPGHATARFAALISVGNRRLGTTRRRAMAGRHLGDLGAALLLLTIVAIIVFFGLGIAFSTSATAIIADHFQIPISIVRPAR